MKPLEQEYRNEGCPNLNTESVLSGSDESFDFEILFEGFEKDFDLPAFFVDADDGAGGEVHEVGNHCSGRCSGRFDRPEFEPIPRFAGERHDRAEDVEIGKRNRFPGHSIERMW